MIYLHILTVILFVLKLLGLTTISWFVVILPSLLPIIALIGLTVCLVMLFIIAALEGRVEL